MRSDGRKADELRPVQITFHYNIYPEGSVLFSIGNTCVLCNLTIDDGIPRWMHTQDRPGGWITAEYALLPRSTQQRTPRETSGLSGRTQEIRRLIGRSLRSVVDLEKLGPRTCILDCDVIQADGGTRCAAITGSYMALVIGLRKLIKVGDLPADVIQSGVAAISAGIYQGVTLLDLNYAEDSQCDVDANIVMNWEGQFIEIQSTAEGAPFHPQQFDELLNLAYKGIGDLITIQKNFLDEI